MNKFETFNEGEKLCVHFNNLYCNYETKEIEREGNSVLYNDLEPFLLFTKKGNRLVEDTTQFEFNLIYDMSNDLNFFYNEYTGLLFYSHSVQTSNNINNLKEFTERYVKEKRTKICFEKLSELHDKDERIRGNIQRMILTRKEGK